VIGHRILVTVTQVIHFIIKISVISLLQYREFVLLNSGLPFSVIVVLIVLPLLAWLFSAVSVDFQKKYTCPGGNVLRSYIMT